MNTFAVLFCRVSRPFSGSRRSYLHPAIYTWSRGFITERMSAPESRAPKNKQKRFQKRTKREKGVTTGTNEDVLVADIRDLLLSKQSNNATDVEIQDGSSELPERFSEIDVDIEMISSTGDGLGFSSSRKHVYVVPFTSPGDKVRAKAITHFTEESYSLTDFVKVIEPGHLRNDEHVKCPYFSRCSGCQFQMMSYKDQLAHKKTVVERAYKHFSNLTPESIPAVKDTMASPLQYGYRTKLTPHFDGPRNARKDKRAGARPAFTEVPPIGFMLKGTRKTLDIEDCPIGTDAIRGGMKSERERVNRELGKYTKGATLLLRESTRRVFKDESGKPLVEASEVDGHLTPPRDPDSTDKQDDTAKLSVLNPAEANNQEDIKSVITDANATSTEYIRKHAFVNPAGAFFQNNNSILPEFTDYIRELVRSPSESASDPPITHLIDAYCGSGLFTITLSDLELISTGIDISESSIDCAQRNARLNNIPQDRVKFRAADAAAIFADVNGPPDQTVVIIDPPRKGCDMPFLTQLLEYGPRRLVYVSCNVHTQARDVATLVEGRGTGEGRTRYKLKSLRGLDFFPQTGHVESVALLERE